VGQAFHGDEGRQLCCRDLPSDDHALDLGRSLADLGELGVAEDALHQKLGDLARASDDARGPGDRLAEASPYGLRVDETTMLTHLLDAGRGIEYVQDHSGHRNIQNTRVSAQISHPLREQVFRDSKRDPRSSGSPEQERCFDGQYAW
jgi:hypothetical protein